jgi:hypothetical protein
MPSTSHTLTKIEQSIAAFTAAPTWAGWAQLRRQHRRYVQTHSFFPGREIEVIGALWRAVCEGPFLVLGWTRDAFIQAINDLVAAGAVIRLVHPDHMQARLAELHVSGNGECCCAKLAGDEIGAIMLENDEVVTWLYPLLAYQRENQIAGVS